MLMAITALCIGLACYVPQRRWVVVAEVNVPERPANVTYLSTEAYFHKGVGRSYPQQLADWEFDNDGGLPPPPPPKLFDRDRFRSDMESMLVSERVISDALFDPRLIGSTFLSQQPTPVEWLKENLVAEYNPTRGNFEIRLEVRHRDGEQLRPIVDAIADAAVARARDQDDADRRRSAENLDTHLGCISRQLDNFEGDLEFKMPSTRALLLRIHGDRLDQLRLLARDTEKRLQALLSTQSQSIYIRRVGSVKVNWNW